MANIVFEYPFMFQYIPAVTIEATAFMYNATNPGLATTEGQVWPRNDWVDDTNSGW